MLFRERLIYHLVRIMGYLPLSLARILGGLLGRIALIMKTRGAHVTQRNIDMCFPELNSAEKHALVKKSMIETGQLALEIPIVWHRSGAWLREKTHKVVGLELYTHSVNRKKGLIILAPHFGNWEMFGSFFSQFEPSICMYQPPKQAFLEPLIKASREKTGVEMVPTSKQGVAKILGALRAGRVTFILPDQCPQEGSGDFSPFFGHDAYTMTLVNGLARRTGCSVLVGAFLRTVDGFHLHFFDAEPGVGSKDRAEGLRALNASVEKCVLMKPEQYQWEYKRFRMRVCDTMPDAYE